MAFAPLLSRALPDSQGNSSSQEAGIEPSPKALIRYVAISSRLPGSQPELSGFG
jgi:hypothetical protein